MTILIIEEHQETRRVLAQNCDSMRSPQVSIFVCEAINFMEAENISSAWFDIIVFGDIDVTESNLPQYLQFIEEIRKTHQRTIMIASCCDEGVRELQINSGCNVGTGPFHLTTVLLQKIKALLAEMRIAS